MAGDVVVPAGESNALLGEGGRVVVRSGVGVGSSERPLDVATADAIADGSSGNVTLRSGSSTTAASGSMTIATGNARAGGIAVSVGEWPCSHGHPSGDIHSQRTGRADGGGPVCRCRCARPTLTQYCGGGNCACLVRGTHVGALVTCCNLHQLQPATAHDQTMRNAAKNETNRIS